MADNEYLNIVCHRLIGRSLGNPNVFPTMEYFDGKSGKRPKCDFCQKKQRFLYIGNEYNFCVICHLRVMVYRIEMWYRNQIERRRFRRPNISIEERSGINRLTIRDSSEN
jgi:hypothetical protein